MIPRKVNLQPANNLGEIEELFSKFAKVVKVRFIREKGKSEHKGFGFVHLTSKEEVEKIVSLKRIKFKKKETVHE